MIRSALEYLMEKKSKPFVEQIGDIVYTDRMLSEVGRIPRANAIKMRTLSSFVEWLKSELDTRKGMIIHVQSPTHVEAYSVLDEERKRECLAIIDAVIPQFPFDTYIEHEKFTVNVQSKFINDPETDKELILKFSGTVEVGTVTQYGDDGVTQKAVVKDGIASKTEAIVPSPAMLRPFRTFREVKQPVSSFVFRMKQDKYDKGIQCALFEADGGFWMNEAMENIKAYLKEELKDVEGIVIIS